MNKKGKALREISDFPSQVREPLVHRFSISTAEEFVSIATQKQEALQAELQISPDLFGQALRAAKAVLSPREIERLTTKSQTKYAKGANLTRSSLKKTGLDKYLKKE